MPIYTILGGTGATGGAIIKALTSTASPTSKNDIQIRIYVRSKSRLLKSLPSLEDHPTVTIIEGSLTDTNTLSNVLRNADVIFSCIATNSSEPTTNIALETAASIIFTLQHLRSTTPSYKPPTVLVLSSMSVSRIPNKISPVAEAFVHTALYFLYEDLERAQKLYRELEHRDEGLLKAIFVQPPGILPAEKPSGYRLSTSEGGDTISFADLGLAMVEIAERQNEFVGGGRGEVTVLSTGYVKPDWSDNLKSLRYGMFCYLFPTVWGIGRKRGWW